MSMTTTPDHDLVDEIPSTTESDPRSSAAPAVTAARASTDGPRPRRRRLVLAAVATAAISTIAVTAWNRADDDATNSSMSPSASDAVTQQLVERGVIPAQTLEPVSDVDAVTQQLVERGVIPAQTLEPVSDVDAVTQQLVERGVIPAQTLGPATS